MGLFSTYFVLIFTTNNIFVNRAKKETETNKDRG